MYKVIKIFYLQILRDTMSAQFYIACLQVAYVFATDQGVIDRELPWWMSSIRFTLNYCVEVINVCK